MLKVYNTLTREKEEFKTIEPDKVKMYVCGLTVQNYSHLGHIRSAMNYDVIRRYLEYKGYEVEYIQNFTDVNEKIVARAKEEGLTPEALADKYTRAYLEDISRLNIKKATRYVKATENIEQIIKMIERLIQKGFAYEVDGNVYFSVDKFSEYGKLSGRNPEEMKAGARIDVIEEKKNPLDFALWKKAPEGAKSWDSPWGKGWPGWHIECSAMAMKYLGEMIDIHGGGTDLIFPHHENEIAQSEACSGVKPFARYWLHNGPVNLKGEKMSKSLGNFFTTRELLEQYTADELRYYILSKHYRTPIDFSQEEMEQTRTSLKRLVNTSNSLEKILNNPTPGKNKKIFEQEELIDTFKARRNQFEEAMDDDFNSARAIGVLHELATDLNTYINNPGFTVDDTTHFLIKEGYNLFHKLGGVLGLSLKGKMEKMKNPEDLEKLMKLIVDIREKARQEKNWSLADWIRDRLQELGYSIKDTPHGTVWEKESE